jgi:EmrB/QacA subfamily drug resistance transporter
MQKAGAEASSQSNRGLVWLVAGAFFMELLDSTVITTALPQMAESFHTQPIHLSTGVSAYLLALAVFIPLSGWMADRFGPRQVFGGALLIFTLASVLCSLSTNLWFFAGARVLQGFGGAMMVPVGRMVVLRATPKERLVHAIATLTWPALGAPVLGPVLGGFITTHWGWHWIFLLNVPFGLIGFLLTLWLINGEPGGRRPFDTPGFVLSGVGCSALMYACDLSAQSPFDAVQVGGASLLGVVMLVWAIRHLRRTPHPLVDLDALQVRTFAVAMRGGSLFRITINSAPFLMPLMFQLAFGFDATTAGLMLLALFAGNISMKPATTPLLRRFGFRAVLLGNGLMVALGFILCLWLTPQTPKPVIMLLMFFTGLSRSMQLTGLSTFSFCDIAHARMSGASTLSSILTQMSAGLGIALGAIVLTIASIWFPASGQGLSMASFQITFVVMALLSLAGLPDIYRLPADSGDLVSGHRVHGAEVRQGKPCA